jgi:hypothetical protein
MLFQTSASPRSTFECAHSRAQMMAQYLPKRLPQLISLFNIETAGMVQMVVKFISQICVVGLRVHHSKCY